MGSPEQLDLLKRGKEAWNAWRAANPGVTPDLSFFQLSGMDLRSYALQDATFVEATFVATDFTDAVLTRAVLSDCRANRAIFDGAWMGGTTINDASAEGAHFRGSKLQHATAQITTFNRAQMQGAKLGYADLYGSSFSEANLERADCPRVSFHEAKLRGARFYEAMLAGCDFRDADLSEQTNLEGANLQGANLVGALMPKANLHRANLQHAHLLEAVMPGANLEGANLRHAHLVKTNLTGARIVDCPVFGVAVWRPDLTDAVQAGLVVSDDGEPRLSVDDLDMAQFIHLITRNEGVRNAIDNLTSKLVLILGSFSDDRKPVLAAVKHALSLTDRVPVIFDFPAPHSRDWVETAHLLGRLSRFVIVDVSAQSTSVGQELGIVAESLSTPFVLIAQEGARTPDLEGVLRRPNVTGKVIHYRNADDLVTLLPDGVIAPAEALREELLQKLDEVRQAR